MPKLGTAALTGPPTPSSPAITSSPGCHGPPCWAEVTSPLEDMSSTCQLLPSQAVKTASHTCRLQCGTAACMAGRAESSVIFSRV